MIRHQQSLQQTEACKYRLGKDGKINFAFLQKGLEFKLFRVYLNFKQNLHFDRLNSNQLNLKQELPWKRVRMRKNHINKQSN